MRGGCILGIGSPAGDDQAGWLTVDALQDLGVGAVKLDRPGASLMPLLEKADWVILVDATQGGGRPGEIRHFGRDDWAGYGGGLSSHGFGLLDALVLAQALGSLPPRLDLYGIEIASANPGEAPGEDVLAAARRLAQRIAASLEEGARGPRAAA
jgi:hydrogenase maturation protease